MGDPTTELHPTIALSPDRGGKSGPASGSAAPPGEEGLPRSWGRFDLRSLLGRGGMGLVFEAWDPLLKRHVALKVLAGTGPRDLERFVRESRAQARVEHPAVCRVYETGDVDGVPFIAMQLVRGGTLGARAEGLPLRRRVELLQQAVEGIHAAHRTGLIHRDVKPSNILVEETDDGRLLPYVVDFGLARVPGEAGLTQAWEATGTPSYMAPEQALGENERMGPRTDVYGIGATLYELVTGRPPASGASALEVMRRVVDEEPAPPRSIDPSLPKDLETIVLRCLEKEPERRYESARALAEDLGRFLDDEPILGRRAGLPTRVLRRARRHPVSASLLGASVLLLVAAVGVLAWSRWRAAEDVRLAQQLGRDVGVIEAAVRHSAMLPAHDVTVDQARFEERVGRLRERLGREDRLSAPSQYALGRAALAVRDFATARTYLEAAWERGLREPAVAWGLGRVYGRLYERAEKEASRLAARDLREERLAEARRLFRNPATRYLAASQGTELEAPEYLAALVAFHDGRYEAALASCEEALSRVPWFWEAPHMAARVHEEMALAARAEGRTDEALARNDAALQALRRAEAIARSAPLVHEALCGTAVQRLTILLEAGRDVDAAAPAAMAVCEAALRVTPGSFAVQQLISDASWHVTQYRLPRGLDAAPSVAASLAAARRAVALGPKEPQALNRLALALVDDGDLRRRRGEDPRPAFREALRGLEELLRLDPAWVDAHLTLGVVSSRIADWERDHGIDPVASFARAIASYERVAGAYPRWTVPHSNLGAVRTDLGRYLLEHGRDPGTLLDEAVESQRRCLGINPKSRRAHNNLGWALRVSADAARMLGRDPSAALDGSAASFRKAIDLDPRHTLAWVNLGEVERTRAEHLLGPPGVDVPLAPERRPAFERAVEESRGAFRRAAELDPGYADAWYGLGEIGRVVAERLLRDGADPGAAAAEALRSLAQAVKLNPDWAGIHWEAGRVHLVLARQRLATGRAPSEPLAKATAAIEKAVALDAAFVDALASRGEVELLRAREARARGRDAASALSAAEVWIGKAEVINPREPYLRSLRAELVAARGPSPAR